MNLARHREIEAISFVLESVVSSCVPQNYPRSLSVKRKSGTEMTTINNLALTLPTQQNKSSVLLLIKMNDSA